MLGRKGFARAPRIMRWTSLGKTLIGLINQIAESPPKSNGVRRDAFWVLSRFGRQMMYSYSVLGCAAPMPIDVQRQYRWRAFRCLPRHPVP
jgi:hypothetical protein